MTQYNVKIGDEFLHGLFQRGEGVARLLNQVLQAQATAPHERSEERTAYPHNPCRHDYVTSSEIEERSLYFPNLYAI